MGILSIFDEGNTDVDTPMELRYMRDIRNRLMPIDSWPHKILGDTTKSPLYKLSYKFLVVMWAMVTLSQVDYIRLNQNKQSFVVIGHTYIITMLTSVGVQRSTLVNTDSFHEVVRYFIQEMHLVYFKGVDEFAMKIHKKVNKICTLMGPVLYFQMWLGCLLFSLTPLLINVYQGLLKFDGETHVNGSLIQGVYYSLPFDYTSWIPGYWIVYCINIFFSFYITTACSMLDNFVLILICHLWGHLKILEYRLRNFPKPASEAKIMYTEEERPAVVTRLKELIIYHNKIFQLSNKISASFGTLLATSFAFHQICCCILLLECSQMSLENIGMNGSLTVYAFGELIMISVSFEMVSSKSESLPDAVYELPWECMGVPERRMVFLFLINSQRPIAVKAMGLVPVGVKTMASIIKTSISYFVMLQAFE